MFRKKDRDLKATGPNEAYEQAEESYGKGQRGSVSRKGIIFVALLLVAAFAAVMTTDKVNAVLPGIGKSSDDRIHKLEMEMVKVKSLQERVSYLEVVVAKKFGQLQGQDGKPLKDEVSDLNGRLEELEKKVSSTGSVKKKTR
ncbi:MAG: hypothetical protein NTV99_08290 [Deltaproteobacteria bacterium]|nr:hypothetical protein [Deltaproteobacteria bacterium]